MIGKVTVQKINPQVKLLHLQFNDSVDITKVRVYNQYLCKDILPQQRHIYLNPRYAYTLFYNKAYVVDIPVGVTSMDIYS